MLRHLRRANLQRLCSLQWALGATEAIPSAAPPCSLQQAAWWPAAAPPAAWQNQQAAPFAKATKKKGGGAAHPGDGDGGATFDLTETKSLMERALEHLQGEMANLRTGRASPGMLDHLKVDVYGDRLPLKACGTVSVRDSQLLVVTVFDADAVPCVVKAVGDSPLRLSPRAEGQEVLVPIPRPTIESIDAMMKVCKVEGEQAKVTVRHARKLAMDAAKKLGSEDERKRVEREVQRLTDEFVKEVDGMVAHKEKSIRSHDS